MRPTPRLAGKHVGGAADRRRRSPAPAGRSLRLPLAVQPPDRPQQPARDEVEVLWAADRVVGVPKGRDEHAGALELIRPRDHRLIAALFAGREWRGLVEDLDVI